eukprot:15453-Pelagococcus_subviridis.AAC.2
MFGNTGGFPPSERGFRERYPNGPSPTSVFFFFLGDGSYTLLGAVAASARAARSSLTRATFASIAMNCHELHTLAAIFR